MSAAERPADRRRFLHAVLDGAVIAALALCVFAAAAGSSVNLSIVAVGKPARWILLAALVVVALVRAVAHASEWRLPKRVFLGLCLFTVVWIESAAWSTIPSTTLERAGTVAVAIVAAATIAGSTATRSKTGQRVLDGILAAIGAVALAGLIVWLVDPGSAIQPATTEYPARFQGFEQNPNTAPMLLAIGMPLALGGALGARTLRRRLTCALLLAGFAGEIIASGSRGGLLAGFLALIPLTVLTPRTRRRRLVSTAAVLACLVVAALLTTIPHALSPASAAPPAANTQPTKTSAPRFVNAELVLPLENEIGSPWWTKSGGDIHRSLFSSSVRLRALRGSLEQAFGRPLTGFGFGLEPLVFVNRYYGFHSGNSENGYVGLLLQVGIVGLGAFLIGIVLCLAAPARRHLRHRATPDYTAVSALAAATAGLLLGLSQSYFHAAGNIAAIAFWTVLAVAAVGGTAPGPRGKGASQATA